MASSDIKNSNVMHITPAFKASRYTPFAQNAVERALDEEPNFKPHPEFPNVLYTSSPAGLIQSLKDTQAIQIVWEEGLLENDEIVSDEIALTTLKALFTLSQGPEKTRTTTINKLKTASYYGFHFPDPDTYQATTKGPGMISLPAETDFPKIRMMQAKDDPALSDLDILELNAGDVTSFGPKLIHGPPKTDTEESRTYVMTSSRSLSM